MKQNSSVTILKVFMVVVTAIIIAMAAFGVGVGVGVAIPKAAALPAPAAELERAPSASPDEAIATPAAPRPTLGLTPEPAKAPTVPAAKNSSKNDKSELDTKLFNEALKLLNTQFYGDVPQGKDVTYDAIRGFVDQLGDQHTAFLDPEQAAAFNSDIEGQFEGIGARVDKAEKGGVEIKYLFAEQPAEKAGCRSAT